VEVLTGRRGRSVLKHIGTVVDINDLIDARAVVASTFVADPIARYVVDILDATRRHPRVRLGASTRGGVALIGLAKANAAISGRHYVVPHDVLHVADAALAHRVIVIDADGSVRAGREVVAECVERVPAPGV
jgi:MoxR-like ATPase